MPKTVIPYLDRNNVAKSALAGSNTAGETVTGHTAFSIDGDPISVATAQNQQALNDAVGDVTSPAVTSGAGSMIGLLKGIISVLSNLSLKASNALIGRVTLADGAGSAYSASNTLRVTDAQSGPSDDAFPLVLGFDYAPSYPNGLILRARVEGTIDVTTKAGQRRVLHWASCETRPIRITKVWDTSNTTASGIEGMV